MKKALMILCVQYLLLTPGNNHVNAQNTYAEQHRPQIHFSPKAHWVNDPNGMVYHNGTYHLFFQYYPNSSTWGPMHWGHATSPDMIQWTEQPIAIYPDDLGYIFSGSAVADHNNTSGLGLNGQPPLVAIYTSHNAKRQKTSNDYETQSIAFSNDDGKTWTKYAGNPVLKNPGITDFRDPKVMWYQPGQKWIMTLATKDRITFYSSPDLLNWQKESEFGSNMGAHGGVWECPDLFALNDNGTMVWVLIVNLNPGGPNKGSGTQYFLGNFDGSNFTATDTTTRWLDYGPDNYAGITWSNTGNRKVLLGWMSNWLYANKVPTEKWRNAMTIPRELSIAHAGATSYIVSTPVGELLAIQSKPVVLQNVTVAKKLDLATKIPSLKIPCRLSLQLKETNNFEITLSNTLGEKLVVGFDKASNQYFIDRTKSGKVNFTDNFSGRFTAPRLNPTTTMTIDLVIDESSIEVFADEGASVMTTIFFPNKPYNKIIMSSPQNLPVSKINYAGMQSIWK